MTVCSVIQLFLFSVIANRARLLLVCEEVWVTVYSVQPRTGLYSEYIVYTEYMRLYLLLVLALLFSPSVTSQNCDQSEPIKLLARHHYTVVAVINMVASTTPSPRPR